MQLSLESLTKRYGGITVLDEIDHRVPEEAKVVALIGPSGGGKSTLLRLVGGLESPDAGRIVFDGKALGVSDRELLLHRRKNGFVFQAFNLFPHLCALENVALPLEKVQGFSPAAANERAAECLARFGLSDHAHKHPAQLSGGQQQRVGIARAIASRPQLLILDEPTSALDPEMTAEVLDVVQELADEGQQILLSTHEMGFARAVCDQVVFLAGGKITEAAEPAAFFSAPSTDPAQRFLSRVMRY